MNRTNPFARTTAENGRPTNLFAYSLPPEMGGPTPTLQTQEQIERLQALLQRKLGPEYLSTRTGGGGTKLTYLEGWRAISLANEVFGFNGWNTEIKELETDYCDQNPETGRFDVGVTARIRVYLKDGTSHEDIGYGKVENCKSKGDALDKCKKEAVTDGLKRALRIFGSLLGNCLYDKSYLEVVGKMKAPKEKIVISSLHRPNQPLTPPCSVPAQTESLPDRSYKSIVPKEEENAGHPTVVAPNIATKPLQAQPSRQGARTHVQRLAPLAPTGVKTDNKKVPFPKAPSSDHWDDEDSAYADVDLDASNYQKTPQEIEHSRSVLSSTVATGNNITAAQKTSPDEVSGTKPIDAPNRPLPEASKALTDPPERTVPTLPNVIGLKRARDEPHRTEEAKKRKSGLAAGQPLA